MLGSGNNTMIKWKTLLKSLEDSGFLWKGFSETIQNDFKEQKGDSLVCY